MNAPPTPSRSACSSRPPLHRRDRLVATTVAGPLGRGLSFCLELAGAVARGLRGEHHDPEERRYE